MLFELFKKKETIKLLSRDSSGVVLGSLDNEPIIDTGLDAVAVFGPARSGKGCAVLIPTLLTWKDSVVVVDFGGHLFDITSNWRREIAGNTVYCFDLDTDHSDVTEFLQTESAPFTVYLKVTPYTIDQQKVKIKSILNSVVSKQVDFAGKKKKLLFILDEFSPQSPYFDFDDLSELNENCIKPIFVAQTLDNGPASMLWDACPVRIVMQQNLIDSANSIAKKIEKIASKSKFIRFNQPPVLPQEVIKAGADQGSIIVDSSGNIIHGKFWPYYKDRLFSKYASV